MPLWAYMQCMPLIGAHMPIMGMPMPPNAPTVI